ncbi:MAG: hypothetical protein GY861_25745 [bacterium]|nr:hypothetical protein [bacterium]
MDPLKLVTKYQKDPIGFMVDCLDVEQQYVWDKMREIAESVRDNDYTCVKAGNSLSKSFTLGRLANWFLFTHYPSTVITTAPSNIQVEEILWREIRDSHAKAKIPLGGKVTKTRLELAEKWFATGFATKPDTVTQHVTRLQGFHNDHVLVILDEAAGVMPEIWEAIDRLMSSEGVVKLVAVGNPTTARGNFVDCFKDKKFNKITVSAFDTPNYKQGYEVIPGLAGQKFVDMVRDKYGEDSNQWKSMITGEIPDEDVDSLLPVSWIEKAECRKVDHKFKTIKRFIIWDVADGGDDKNVLKAFENTTEIDEVVIRGKKIEEVEPYAWKLLKETKGNCIIVDTDGIGRVAASLLHQGNVSDTHIIEFSGMSKDVIEPDTFMNRRHEAHWKMREMFEKNRLSISKNPEQREELASIKLVNHKRGFIAIEPKKELKKRIGRSPDYGDCIMMMCGCFDEIPITSKVKDGYEVAEGRDQDYYFTPATC